MKIKLNVVDPQAQNLHTALGISDQRVEECNQKGNEAIIDLGDEVTTSASLEAAVGVCETLEEAILTAYAIGASHGHQKAVESVLGDLFSGDED